MTNIASGRRVHFATILLATEFSPTSDRAFEFALALAERYGATLHLVHVVSGDLTGEGLVPDVRYSTLEQLRRTAEEQLTTLANDAQARQVRTRISALHGPMWPALEAYIQQEGVDLIVAGTHGRRGWSHAALGSGAEEIFRHASLPVLVVGHARQKAGVEPMKTIVYATDLSPTAAPAAEYAASLAQEFEAKLILLHVPPAKDMERQVGVALMRSYVEELKSTVPESAAVWANVEYDIAPGKPKEQVLEMAQKRGADLIVIGARHAGGLAARLPSTAHHIIAHAVCPVLVIPNAAPAVPAQARDVA